MKILAVVAVVFFLALIVAVATGGLWAFEVYMRMVFGYNMGADDVARAIALCTVTP